MAAENDVTEQLLDGARYGDGEDVASALRQGVDVNTTDEAGRTGLHMACANGHVEVVRQLLEAGADDSWKNLEGNTPLHWACLNGHAEVVRLLMQKGASPSSLNRHDQTPVDEALNRGFQQVMDVINEITEAGRPSMSAVSPDAEFKDAEDLGINAEDDDTWMSFKKPA